MAALFQCLTFGLLCFLISQQTVSSLKCYVCSNCPKPTNLVTIERCESGCSCTKITTLVGGKVDHVGRSSLPTSSCTEYNLVNGGTGYFQNCCTKDACNATTRLTNSFLLLSVVLIIVKALIIN